ncbi:MULTISPECIES: 16S rRNA (adenine(1518)-N(6)/adenine(1519)-N(6))-dimethyltransferase RsmA [Reichenbachiella]|uniref:Ribosomal RNA small subunit methyltransferase A n=1 Tax=Reichenbachiella agariperforans TaxID=156994 RepID=A0A1M6UMG5_REIAG|nr:MULTISPECIES: 16S rRNA (adenine(1518)-N(6)/adenine(1519)-N(6))-dimethyltransferase RsmA [Reichenbachiella]MBU2912728.1 16S rRNA (adenine(1518)-N(6)/adenine(1519)-N(6))-dimethyltransferase RsmA [Reichenbachiella agariperforans]RJE72454.1 16S rRNA (adenine(1518)-N(6)/adenine(1519)-N(6))-dimethyltransferase [Reichenbachiella sp. MSK19-1]SHK70323.1 16S rRNA (adenine1518-N6/adenine1519-N6)-dimethyltransferase [Reichenbachiella agariperforans]
MAYVKPKKRLGQHFLTDLSIAENIVSALTGAEHNANVLEIGPGTGVLSDFLIEKASIQKLVLLDLDKESIDFLEKKYEGKDAEIRFADFLREDLNTMFDGQSFSVIGNFPYNISSQIFFKVLDYKDQVDEVVCMLQKEVAVRIASREGNKDYGILSVLLQAYYDIDYLFTVPPTVFNPPPKVNSGVIKLKRNQVTDLGCDEKMFKRVVKAGFQMRRKTLRNAMKPLALPEEITAQEVFNKRAEQLSVDDFIALTKLVQDHV